VGEFVLFCLPKQASYTQMPSEPVKNLRSKADLVSNDYCRLWAESTAPT
jgi:hypothetical protein